MFKYLLFLIVPFNVFSQVKNDTIISDIKSNLMKSYSLMNKVIIKDDNFSGFKKEMKSLGVTIRNNQQIAEHTYQWNYDKSLGYNIIGNTINNILNKKKLNP